MRRFILTAFGGFLLLAYGCIEKMPLPAIINEDVEFAAGDTTYLIMNPIWDSSYGFFRSRRDIHRAGRTHLRRRFGGAGGLRSETGRRRPQRVR
jgi:hypothetical protein